MTVRENLEFPLVRNSKNMRRSEIDKSVETVLDAVGLSQTINQLPSELSGGQRKRIGIARTLILQPEIMLYDEPTAGLDPTTCIEINNLINEVQERYHTSAIIITHDLTCAKATGDRMAILLDGKFASQGSFEEVFATDDERIKSFFNYNFIQDK
jgi:phospholipid/cholesterol/gamma-HCH transport system ATP-binding protein